jgi:2-keto-4-pentenoate hydratase/2-oxohepta-3-ene-1,7-dioic acid hydratase in catechol pathway
VIGPAADVAISPGSAAFDYELEIAAVIGRAGADLSPAQAVDHIAGFVLFCDWIARDLQGAEMALNLGPRRARTAPTASARGC